MDNQDKLFNQIKSAEENAETKDFPSMEKIWSRVEDKLDQKVLSKENTLWKKIAFAASVLLFLSIMYQFLKEDKISVIPNNSVTTIKTEKVVIDTLEKKNSIVSNELTIPIIKENAQEIIEKQAEATHSIVAVEPVNSAITEINNDEIEKIKELQNNAPVFSNTQNNNWLDNPKFESLGVVYKEEVVDKNEPLETPNSLQKMKKYKPLVVMSDKNSNLTSINSDSYKLSNLSEKEIDSIIHLPNPLYIINGVYYTEPELFGPNPTSPYAPLSKQKIETISILQNEKAISIYGEKGKEGVVIITTKDGKPIPKKR